MNRTSILVLALGAIAAATPVAAAPLEQTLPCFLRSDLANHTVGDGHTLYQDVNGLGVYRVVMSNSCLVTAVTSDPVIWRNRTGSSRICHQSDVYISAAGRACLVDRIELMTPAEVAALPKKVRP